MQSSKAKMTGRVIWHGICAPLISTFCFWGMWNHFTDPTHPLPFEAVLVTAGAVTVASWTVRAVVWLVLE